MDQPTPQPSPETPPFEWAIVEVFGHRRHAGRAREEERFGSKMLRIDIPRFEEKPGADGAPATLELARWETLYYGGGSIFSFALTDEASVMRINKPYLPPSRVSLPSPDEPDFDFANEEDVYDDDPHRDI